MSRGRLLFACVTVVGILGLVGVCVGVGLDALAKEYQTTRRWNYLEGVIDMGEQRDG